MLVRSFSVLAVAALAATAACAGPNADAQSAVPLATAVPDDPPPPEEPATLDILAAPPVEVLVDGKPAGKTPVKGFKVKSGSHDVTFVDETGNRTMTVSVDPGEGKTVKSDRPPSLMQQKK
jgi:hypothetical protein